MNVIMKNARKIKKLIFMIVRRMPASIKKATDPVTSVPIRRKIINAIIVKPVFKILISLM